MSYDFRSVEAKWRERWARDRIFEADPEPGRPKVFITFPFPYVNGPLHLGHAYTATRLDVYARFKRMQGYNVLYPWAWHWTGEPITGMAKRVAEGDEAMIKMLKNIDKVPDSEIKRFTDPLYIATYYTNRARRDLPLLGLSLDMRREFTTTSHNKGFSKFVKWQYRKLKRLGYITIATHPVVWCPRDKSPTGDHDRLVGEGVGPEKFYLLKFPFEDGYMPAATFRPETIFGATNIWIHPEATYVWLRVDGEKWLVSKETQIKLVEQNHQVEFLGEVEGRELLGKHALNPLTGDKLPILPAWFVDPAAGTGVVFSVPGHAPYDWLGLKDLKEHPELLSSLGLDPGIVDGIEPISIIRVEGYGDYPAIEACEKHGAHSQKDVEAADRATKEVYKAEFHKGVMKENCGRYAGMPVSEAKERLVEELEAKGFISYLYDTPEPVVCRCGTRCIVKILTNQWFIRYSDPEWKERARKLVNAMNIYPGEIRNWFLSVIDWLEDKAFTRQSGLGTQLPWDKAWIIEPLSDSTIYMAYYTISKYVNMGVISPERMNDKFFDYVLLGQGEPRDVEKSTGIPADTLRAIREEFLYWYPVDLRGSGKDLVPNHLTFFIFHHTAIFPPEHWPRGVTVNGFVKIEGKPLSKRAGRIVAIYDSVMEYGADTVRFTLISSADGIDDPNWSSKRAAEVAESIRRFYDYVLKLYSSEGDGDESRIDRWLLSRLQRRIKNVTEYLENMRLRMGLIEAFYNVWNDLRWYERRRGGVNPGVVREVIDVWIRLVAPFIPFVAEELWEKTGHTGYVSLAKWPEYREELVSPKEELVEEQVDSLLKDIAHITEVTGITPKKVVLYLPAGWKYEAGGIVADLLSRGGKSGKVVSTIMRDERFRRYGKAAVAFVRKFTEYYWELSEEAKSMIGDAEEIDRLVVEEASKLLERELNVEVEVYREGDDEIYDPAGRASRALPFKPAIYVE